MDCSCYMVHQPHCRLWDAEAWRNADRPRRLAHGLGGKRAKIVRRDNRRCQYCGRKCSRDVPQTESTFLTFDHIIPLSRGGHRTSDMNIVVCCALCNSLKGNRMPWEIEMWPLNGLGGCWATTRPEGAG